jgi:hypothetical protein
MREVQQKMVQVRNHLLLAVTLFLLGKLTCFCDENPHKIGKKVARRQVPFILVLPTYRNCDSVIDAWNSGLGRGEDIVVFMPTPQDMKDPTRIEALYRKIKHGSLGWATPSAELVLKGKCKIPPSAKWLWYDPEPWQHTPQKEKDDPVAAAKALREYCDKHKLKLGMTPIYTPLWRNFNVEFAAQVAAYCDAYILQCQDWQKDPQRLQQVIKLLRDLEKAIHNVNPKCMVGCQLGAAQRYGGVSAALRLYEATKDFIQIYTAWWEPEDQQIIDLLKAMDSR